MNAKPLTPETIVELLNDICYDQTEENCCLRLKPFEYISSGDSWAIQFLGEPVADSEESPGNSPDAEELLRFVIEETEKQLEAIRRIDLKFGMKVLMSNLYPEEEKNESDH